MHDASAYLYLIAAVWFAYRMIKGWMRLNAGRAIP